MAQRKTGDKKLTEKKNRSASGKVSKVQADHYSIAFEKLEVGGDVGGDIRIGHTIGYTAEQVSVLLKQITTTLQPKPFDGRCPYKGLEVFEEEDAELFFGRERLVNELVGRVKESRTVFITGPSGSGKSSLVRAGLIHALRKGAIRGSDRWLYETMKPGREPLKDLALAFSRLKLPELEDYFLKHASETDILNKCAESVLSGRKDQRFVLFIDQFEEVFTQINSEAEWVAFINMLAHAGTLENGRVIVLFAMRSDFVSNCATYPALNELLSQEFRQIGAMQPEELVSAIALPAMHVGLPVENELIAQIINDMKGEPDALPLMQFALKDLFDAKQAQGGVIALTLKDYLQHGGIHKSLERHADATFAKLSESEQELTRSIFSGLIEIGRGTQDTKRTALFDELIPANTKSEDVLNIVQKLADARLIITDEQAGKDTVTISHEKLIEAWPWLKKLVNENRDVIALQNEIAADAKEWEDHNRDESYLYTGARLANAREKLETNKIVLSGLAYEFVNAGQAKQRSSQRTRILGVAIPIGLVIVAIMVFSYISATAAKRSEEFAKVQQAVASTSQAIAITARANAEEAQKQTNIALARQLAAQAQSIFATGYSRQTTAVLLAAESMRFFPIVEAAQILQNNSLARPISRMAHEGAVISVAFSPDGKYVVSGSADLTARVWEATTGKEVARMTHEGAVISVAFSSLDSGKYVVSGGGNTVRVWEAATGKEVARMAHEGAVTSVAFSPDGRYVVSGSADLTARVWEVSTGREAARMTHSWRVNSVAFSPDGKYVVSIGDYTARIWEATTGKEIARMIHDLDVNSVAFRPDGKYVVSAGDNTVWIWEASTGNEIARMTHDFFVSSVAFSPDGKYVVSAGGNTVRVWNASTGNEIARLTNDGGGLSVAFSPDSKYVVSGGCILRNGNDCVQGPARVWEVSTSKEVTRITHDNEVTSVAFSPDGKYIVSGSKDNTARVWEVSTGREAARITHDGSVSAVVFSPDGKYMVSASCDEDDFNCPKSSARVWEISTGKEVARMTTERYLWLVAFSPDGKYVVSGSCNEIIVDICPKGSARVWEASTGKEVARITLDGAAPSAVTFSPDGNYVVSGGQDNTARLWEASTGKEVARMTHDYFVSSVAFSPDGKYVVSGSGDLTARVWEASTGKEVARMTHDNNVTSVAFSPDGKYVVSGSRDSTARVWEASTGKEVARMTHGYDGYYGVTAAAFSPDGKYVVSVGGDLTARVWEASTGKEVALMTYEANVYSVAFSPDGKYVVSSGCDLLDISFSCIQGSARVWEASTGREVARMTQDTAVYSVAFSPDGKYVASNADNIAQIWMWRPNDLIANACAHLPRNLTRAEWRQYIGDALPYQAVCNNLPVEPVPTQTTVP